MKKVLKALKVFIYSILILALLFFYLFFTDSGKKLSYNILSFIATQKIGLYTKVSDIDVTQYPYMKAKLLIGKKYALSIDGVYKDKKFNLDYTLISACIESNVCKIKSDVDITGKIQGPRKSITITGHGTALDGNISYVGVKYRHSFNNVRIDITDINASKLAQLLGQKAIFDGAASGYLDFDIISHKTRKGTLYYHVKDKDYHGVNVDLQAQIDINNEKHNFTLKVTTPTASLNLLEGKYNQEHREGSAAYVLDVKNVSDLKGIVKVNYDAPFYAVGKLSYDHKKLHMQGLSESLGGVLDLVFKENKLHFYLHNIPLTSLMKNLDVNPLFDTNLTGIGVYDLKRKTVKLDAALSTLSFFKSKITKSLLKASSVDLSKEVFDDNHLHLETIDKKLSTTLTLANKKNHLRFKNTQVNSDNHSVKSRIDLNMYRYALRGDLYLKMDKYTKSNDTYLNFDGIVQKHYALKLKGLVNKEWISMDYGLTASRLPSPICTIVDDVNVSGHVSGPFKRLHIDGRGTALDGNVSYKGVNVNNHLEDVQVDAKNIHALKLSTLLGYPKLPYGKGNLKAEFSYLSKVKQTGNIYYSLRDATFLNLPLAIETHVKVKSKKQKFTADVTLANATLTLTKGIHSNHKGITKTFYTLDVHDLTAFENLLGYKYKGSFYAVGTGEYDGKYHIHGLSKTFDGYTEFDYDKNVLDIDLSKVSFKHIMALFPYPAILDASTTGNINYDFNEKKLVVKTKLKNAKFSYFKEMDTLYRKTDINLLKETFPNSSLDINYQHKIILANLIMESKTSHLSLTNANINTKLKSINGYFDVKMQGKEFSGKVYGPLAKPKVNLNLQKLIRHEMDRQLDTIVGEGNRKMMQNMPMGGVAEDMASGMGGAFMGMFF